MGSTFAAIDTSALCAVLEGAPIGIAILGPDGHPCCSNRSLQALLGYTAEELAATTLSELSHPGDAAGDAALLEELLDGGRDEYQIHKRFVCKDGRIFWARQSATRHADEHRSTAMVMVTIEDISAARSTEERLRTMVDTLGERVKELTALHRAAQLLLPARGAVLEQFGDLAQNLRAAMQYPQLATACITYGGVAYATDGHAPTNWMTSAVFRTSDGTDGRIEVAYREARSHTGDKPFLLEEEALLASLAEMIVAAVDRRHMEQALRQAHERLDLAFTATGMGIWEWDVRTGASRWSAHLSQMLGIAGTTGTFGDRFDIVHPDDRAPILERLKRAAEGLDDLRDLSLRFATASGYRRFTGTALIVRDSTGATTRILVALIDAKEQEVFASGQRPARRIMLATG